MSALSEHAEAMDASLRALARRPLSTAFALLLITLAVALPLSLAVLALPLQALWQRIDAPPQAMVFVAAGTGAQELAALRVRIADLPGVTAATPVSRDAALADLARHAPGGALPELKSNPLPDAIVVDLARGQDPAAVEATLTAVRKLARVESVQFDVAWNRRWQVLSTALRVAAGAAAAALVALALAAVAAAARLPAGSASDELRLLALVGASPAYRRRRPTYAGAALGLAGGALGCAAVAGGLAALRPTAATLSGAIGQPLAWTLPPWQVLVGLVVASGCLGAAVGAVTGHRAARRTRP